MRETSRDDGTWFTVRDGAPVVACRAAVRAALTAQRDRLARTT